MPACHLRPRSSIIGLSPWGPMTIKTETKNRPTLNDFIVHIDYVAQRLFSADHIGIGTE
jgi:membrane dipeptidase